MRKYPARLVALAALLGACAPASNPNGVKMGDPTPSFNSRGSSVSVRLNPDDPRTSRQMRATPAQVWAALPIIYGVLGIRPELVDSAAMTYGSTRVTNTQLGGKRTGSYLRCGNDGSGPSAVTTQRYRLAVVTTLRPSGTGTVVTTRVDGSATRPDAGASAATYCASTGELEHRIVELLQARVGG